MLEMHLLSEQEKRGENMKENMRNGGNKGTIKKEGSVVSVAVVAQ